MSALAELPNESPELNVDQQISERVRLEIASHKGLKHIHVARAIGMPQQGFSDRVNGKTPFSASTLAQVANYLGQPIDYFIPDELSAPGEIRTPKPSDPKSDVRPFSLIQGGLGRQRESQNPPALRVVH